METTPKDYNIQLDTKNKIIGESITLVQGDNLGNIFHFTLTENDEAIDLTGATVTITMVKTDNTKLVNQCTVTNAASGKCDYIVDIDALAIIGQVVYTVEIFKNGGRTTTTQAKFKVIGELDDGTGAVSEGNYNVLSTLIEEVNTFENTTTTNEATRQANETTRISNENTRIASENTRIINENTRQSNEAARITSFDEFTEYMNNEVANATNYAISRGNYANEEGNNAQSAAVEAREAISDFQDAIYKSKKIYMPSVATYSNILTTYPVPQEGWTVQAKDTHIEYRWDGFTWVDIGISDEFQGYNVWVGPTPPTNVNLLWVYTATGTGKMVRIIPSITEPIDKTQIWLKLT